MGYLIVFLGGGIGAALRHGFNLAFARLVRNAFPRATLFENVSGSIVMGMLIGFFAFKSGIAQHWQLFLTTGILGGYTTFSTFSLDVALLYQRGELGLALCDAVGGAFRRRPVRWPGPGSQSRLVHWTQAELVEQCHIAVAGGIRSRKQLWPVKDRVGAGDKAESLRFLAHVLAASR